MEEQLEAMVFEKERLAQAKQAMERKSIASHKLESVLQQELKILKMEREKFLKERENMEKIKILKEDLQKQLSSKSEAAEHYKTQVGVATNNPHRAWQ